MACWFRILLFLVSQLELPWFSWLTGSYHDIHDTQALYTNLPQTIADFINNTHIKYNERIEDAFIWNHNKNGDYTAKVVTLGYFDTRISPPLSSNLSWTWIRKLRIHEKFKLLIWLVCHNAVRDVGRTMKLSCIAFMTVVSPKTFGLISNSRLRFSLLMVMRTAGLETTLQVCFIPPSLSASGGHGDTGI